MTQLATFEWTHHIDGSVDVLVHNRLTGAEETRHYKTKATARTAIKRLSRRLAKIYDANRCFSVSNTDGEGTSVVRY